MRTLLKSLAAQYPQIRFTAGATFYWSPETQEVFYNDLSHSHTATGQQPPCAECERRTWSLLHETGHALLSHTTYTRDIELLKLELDAWDKARELAKPLGIIINEDHIQDCLDTYRDWLHARSICPTCTTKCLQQSDPKQYRCHNCHTKWQVTPARFARPYRSVKAVSQAITIFASEA